MTYIRNYEIRWHNVNNNIISLCEIGKYIPCGVVEVSVFKEGEQKGEAYIWNLHVRESMRGKGYGRQLLEKAIEVAFDAGCTKATLEWDIKDSPQWVLDWYVRNGFEEKEFGRGYAHMEKTLEMKLKGNDYQTCDEVMDKMIAEMKEGRDIEEIVYKYVNCANLNLRKQLISGLTAIRENATKGGQP